MKEIVHLDGKPLDENLPLRSLLYAEGVFETFRWKNSPPVFLKNHIERMSDGAELLRIPFPGAEKVRKDVEAAVKASGIEDAYVKICLMSSGPLKFYELADRGHLLAIVRVYEPPDEHVRAHVSSFRRRSSPLLAIKSLNYLENVLARREAKSMGYDEAIFLNAWEEVTEGSSTNIFWVKSNVLHTPALECGLLPGITRDALISLAPELGLGVKEGKFTLKDVLNSQGAFFTNSLIGITAISAVDGVKINLDDDLYAKLKGLLLEKLGWVD